MTTTGTPRAEIEIDAGLVERLLREQVPSLAGMPVQPVASGWDNAIFRVGDHYAARLPRRREGVPLVVNEQRWLPVLASRLPLPIPTPLNAGRPSPDYPWPWSIVPWFAGETADTTTLEPAAATALGSFLRKLHVAAPSNAPHNPVRGVPLTTRAASLVPRLQRLHDAGLLDQQIEALWADALDAQLDAPRQWLHGDLHPRNVLVADGRIHAIIDWGDIAGGDPATDLGSLWMLFESPALRERAWRAYGDVSAATRLRAMGWATLFGVVLLDSGRVDNPAHAAIGTLTLGRLAEDYRARS